MSVEQRGEAEEGKIQNRTMVDGSLSIPTSPGIKILKDFTDAQWNHKITKDMLLSGALSSYNNHEMH